MRQPPPKVRLAAVRTGILRRPPRVLLVVAIAIAGVLVDRFLIGTGDVWGTLAAFGVGSWLGSGWVQQELVRQTPGRSPAGPERPAGGP